MNFPDGIRSIEIDLDKGILKINGQEVKDEVIIVALPGPEEGYKYRKAFNMKNEQNPGSKEIIEVSLSYSAAATACITSIGENRRGRNNQSNGNEERREQIWRKSTDYMPY